MICVNVIFLVRYSCIPSKVKCNDLYYWLTCFKWYLHIVYLEIFEITLIFILMSLIHLTFAKIVIHFTLSDMLDSCENLNSLLKLIIFLSTVTVVLTVPGCENHRLGVLLNQP